MPNASSHIVQAEQGRADNVTQPPLAPEAVAWSRRHGLVFAVSLLALALVPWIVRHWPSQDGPNHLAIAHVPGTGPPSASSP